ncbi:hypothetical protein D3C75_618150 [compost metagenome]
MSRLGDPGIDLPHEVGTVAKPGDCIHIDAGAQILGFIGLLLELHRQLARKGIDGLHHLFQLATLGLGNGVPEMVKLYLDRLIANELERFEQVVECPHQQYGGDQEAHQEPGRQLAHPLPELVVGLSRMAHDLQLAQLQPARRQNGFVGYLREEAQPDEPLRHPLNVAAVLEFDDILGSQQIQANQPIVATVEHGLHDGFGTHLVPVLQIRRQRQTQGGGGVDDCGLLLLRQIVTGRIELYPVGGGKQQSEQ